MTQSSAIATATSIDQSVSTPASTSSTSKYASGEFFGRLWRTAGIQYVVFFIVIAVIYGSQPGIGASADTLGTFYSSNSTRILIAAALSAFNLLNLLWFAAALRTTLADTGQDGWGSAATAASAVYGGLSVLAFSIEASLSYSVASYGDSTITTGANSFLWALVVLMSFPRAMLIMSGVFGLWRAGLISNALFSAGVVLVVLGVLGGFTLSDGFLAPDGAYTRFVSPALLLIWVVVVSLVLSKRSSNQGNGW